MTPMPLHPHPHPHPSGHSGANESARYTAFLPAETTLILEKLETGRIVEALDSCDAAIAGSASVTATPLADTTRLPMMLALKSAILVVLGKPLDALRDAHTAREQAHRIADPFAAALVSGEAAISIAFALQAMDEQMQALETIGEVETIARQINDDELLGRAIRLRGISLSVLGEHPAAEATLAEASQLLQQHSRSTDRIAHAQFSVLNARSRAVGAINAPDAAKLDQVRELHDAWVAFSQEVQHRGMMRLRAMAMGNAGVAAGMIARITGETDQALETLQAALALQREVGLGAHIGVSLAHIGAVLITSRRAAEAVAALRESLAILDGGSRRELANTWELLSEAYEMLDQPREALAALKTSHQLYRGLHDDDARVVAARHEQKTEIGRLAKQWRRLADEDALTGLENRRSFDRRLLDLTQLDAVTLEPLRPIALALFDLDFFKLINDRFGHATGDLVLREFALIVRRCIRDHDVAARIGGEEIAVLFEVTDIAPASAVVERIRSSVEQHDWESHVAGLSVSVSVGIAHSSSVAQESSSLQTLSARLFALADMRLYAAKRGGRNRVVDH